MTKPPLPLGTYVPGLGEINMIGLTGGERYYWLTSNDGVVSMMPWFMVETEQLHRDAGHSDNGRGEQ